jgi:hypothetical protein
MACSVTTAITVCTGIRICHLLKYCERTCDGKIDGSGIVGGTIALRPIILHVAVDLGI